GIAVRFGTRGIRFDAPAGGIGVVLAAAGEAMADGSWQRLKACRSDSCRWAFVDNARNRSRQWCSMSVCGNREKARTFRRRRTVRA
ncbi:MAG TPA: CGNR zinc finger domain-containing protein, partial [Gaiellaceae bacterium]|nr:CGNR zinc finger domain-containing protein [Gaiellaceae bacterium]